MANFFHFQEGPSQALSDLYRYSPPSTDRWKLLFISGFVRIFNLIGYVDLISFN
jgi:hypothetical protein